MLDILKITITALAPIVFAIPIMFLKFIHLEESDLLFETKINQVKLNFSNNIIKYILLSLALFLGPAFAFHFIDGLALIKEYGNSGAFKTFLSIGLLVFYISLITTTLIVEKWSHKTKLVKFFASTTIVSCLTFYCPLASSAIYDKNLGALPVLIAIPLLVILIIGYVSYTITPKIDNKPLCRIVSEDYIKELDLVHSHMLNDGRTVLYDKYRSKKEVFYVCDYSSKVYLELLPPKTKTEED
ncbi:hypothetical protein V7457_00245 [Bacillus toyonensis]|uniref:hypothetical protein n=1 Tax=Bacillus toyonensis TaxID=155322 RepID=UPI000BEB9FC2|nr:hypothetical protein [Bacillus toyonensis]PDY54226.1 hypothetical protein CON61_05120 [Bacillus toyonensis]PEM97658.1 hypothetical protein CN629_05100 [Bacillus toyonensis]